MAGTDRSWRRTSQALRHPRQHINVGDAERWASAAAAAALATWAIRRDRRNAWWASALGAALLYRATTGHCPIYETVGANTAGHDTRRALGGRRGVHVLESITINRPVAEVYGFWRNLENLPVVMSHLESVTSMPDGRSHWVAKGPAGTSIEWDAVVIHEEANRVIGWRSVDGAMVTAAGSVRFEPTTDGRGTHVRVRFQYEPVGGHLGAWIAWLTGEEPSVQVREDLRRLKAALEGGA